jgi:hypothetical protein
MRTNCVLLSAVCSLAAAAQPCETVMSVGSATVVRSPGGALVYRGGLMIDADGAPTAYGPDGKGLDHLANAGKPGNWWGVVTVDGKPVVQENGYYVSTTSLEDKRFAVTDPKREEIATEGARLFASERSACVH